MPCYSLSLQAEADLEGIVIFSIRTFGLAVAQRYYASLRGCIDQIARHPGIGRKLQGRTRTFYRHPCRSHVIFYEIDQAAIRVVRILHGRRDAERTLS